MGGWTSAPGHASLCVPPPYIHPYQVNIKLLDIMGYMGTVWLKYFEEKKENIPL